MYIVYTSLNCVKHIYCKYLMYVMTHYRLILTKDCQKTDLTSRQVTALARTSSYSKLLTRPLVREGATT
jgi:hypothetical protein